MDAASDARDSDSSGPGDRLDSWKEIAAYLRRSPRTVQRWLTAIRERILDETRRLLHERFPLSEAQFESVVGLVRSQIELSVRRLLGEPEDP